MELGTGGYFSASPPQPLQNLHHRLRIKLTVFFKGVSDALPLLFINVFIKCDPFILQAGRPTIRFYRSAPFLLRLSFENKEETGLDICGAYMVPNSGNSILYTGTKG
jgi:hypothetical protein